MLSTLFLIFFFVSLSRQQILSYQIHSILSILFFIFFKKVFLAFVTMQRINFHAYHPPTDKRRRRDLNPRAAINDLLPFQGSPFNHLGTSAWLIHNEYLFSKASHCVCLNGESGIRTHAPFRTNGFQDRLVMTASISLQTCFSIIQDKKRFVKSFFNLFFLVFSYFVAVHQQLSYNIMAGSICQHFFYIFSKTFSGSFSDPSKHSKMP